MKARQLQTLIPSIPASDGAGVKLRRSLGSRPHLRVDPFLMLDEFFSDDPNDYVAGFPSHPHRGFETVTYMLNGHMQHEDHLGNRGDLGPGSVQWMTAGRGIIHSEMPQQREGRMRGFQLWINLPAQEKTKAAAYRDIPAEQIPHVTAADGVEVKVIAGAVAREGERVEGPVRGVTTEPLYLDIDAAANAAIELPVTAQHSAFVYVYDGALEVGPDYQTVVAGQAGVLSDGDAFVGRAKAEGARFLLLAGKPLREPIVQYGPFVMNTRDEIEQAIADYQSGRFGVQ